MSGDLVKFLAERYAEEWTAARNRELAQGLDESHATRDVDAKRQILAWHAAECTCSWCDADGDDLPGPDQSGYGCPTLLILAGVYRGHPDYDAAWAQHGLGIS